MNLSAERMAFIRHQIESGVQLEQDAVLDLQGHNDHLIQIWEARGRLLLITEGERDQLKAENDLLSSRVKLLEGYEAEFVQIAKDAEAERDQLKAENEALRKDAERWQFIRDEWPRVKLNYNGEWFNSEFLERKIDAAMSKEASHD